MKLITTASYYGTGSSAVTDLLSEYSNVKALNSNFECRFAYDMFGLSDLEYYLVDNHHRHNSSTAINMFMRLMGIYGLDRKIRLESYDSYFGDSFAKAVDDYIKRLAPFSYKGGSHVDIYMKSDTSIMVLKLKDRLYHLFHRFNLTIDDTTWASKGITPYEREIHKSKCFISYPRTDFINATQEFTSALFDGACENDTDYLMVDQLVPPSNTTRYLRYFKDLYVICVDRDPRDVYYNEKKYWKGGIVPEEAKLFVEWYKATRSHKKYEIDDPKRILRINFEDLVFTYEDSVKMIEELLGIDCSKHVNAKLSFNPEISVNNIGKWKNDKEEFDNISYIEEHLCDMYNMK